MLGCRFCNLQSAESHGVTRAELLEAWLALTRFKYHNMISTDHSSSNSPLVITFSSVLKTKDTFFSDSESIVIAAFWNLFGFWNELNYILFIVLPITK